MSCILPNKICAASADATMYCYQRKPFYCKDLWWVFYIAGGRLYYRTSADGETWSNATDIGACSAGDYFAVIWDEETEYFCFARHVAASQALFYRAGQPESDGVIYWSEDWQEAVPGIIDVSYSFPGVAALYVKAEGTSFPFVTYSRYPGWLPYITKSVESIGDIWDTAPGYPLQLGTTSTYYIWPGPVGDGIYVLYGSKGKYWDKATDSWGSEETLPFAMSPTASVIFNEEKVHFWNVVDSKTKYAVRENGAWGSPTELSPDQPFAEASGSLRTVKKDLWCLREEFTVALEYSFQKDSVWEPFKKFVDFTNVGYINGQDRWNGLLGLVFMNIATDELFFAAIRPLASTGKEKFTLDYLPKNTAIVTTTRKKAIVSV